MGKFRLISDDKVEALLRLAWYEAIQHDPITVARNLAVRDLVAEAKGVIRELLRAGVANDAIVVEIINKLIFARAFENVKQTRHWFLGDCSRPPDVVAFLRANIPSTGMGIARSAETANCGKKHIGELFPVPRAHTVRQVARQGPLGSDCFVVGHRQKSRSIALDNPEVAPVILAMYWLFLLAARRVGL